MEDESEQDGTWNRAIDNAVILMCLLVTRNQLTKWKGSKKIAAIVGGRIDKLIQLYKDPAQ